MFIVFPAEPLATQRNEQQNGLANGYCGKSWQRGRDEHGDIAQIRQVLTAAVLEIELPALGIIGDDA